MKEYTVDWEPWTSLGVRSVPIDNYIAYYLVHDDIQLVTVVRLFYGGQDVKQIIQEHDQ